MADETRRTYHAEDDETIVVIVTRSIPPSIQIGGKTFLPDPAMLSSKNIKARVRAIRAAAEAHDQEVLEDLKYQLLHAFLLRVAAGLRGDELDELADEVLAGVRILPSWPEEP